MTAEMPPSETDAPAIYATRLASARAIEATTSRQAARLGLVRLGVFGAAIFVAVLGGLDIVTWHALWLPLLAFVVLVLWHARVNRRLYQARQRIRIHEQGVRRLEDAWAGTGRDGLAYAPEGHVFADDLDLFGRGSLFELLCTARTRAGEECLARWLITPADPDEVRARQEAIEELRSEVDLREALSVVGGEVDSALDRAAATEWGEAPIALRGAWLPWVARVLGIVSATAFFGWTFGGWPGLPMAALLLAQFVLTLPTWGRVAGVLDGADRPSQDLVLVGRLLRRLEQGGFRSAWLQSLAAMLETDGVPPSKRIRTLTRLTDFVDARRNQIFLPVSWLLCLGTQLAYAIERWRTENGKDLGRWVDAVGAFEAINALAGYAYEHPNDPFAEVVAGGAVFEGVQLGHPLLPDLACVRNDLWLGFPASESAPQAVLVSGSNMSGKSTMLRTVGVNVVLALAGAPVRAERLRLSPLALGASIRITDSLQAGASHFYAEIERLHRVVDLAKGGTPALFMLDEMLHGTNSHDRRIGAEAVIHSLLDAGALGLVTTHDLALADVADEDARMENVHFEDELVDGRMRFDYRLKEGVVTRSNAIALMRAVGLDV